MFLYLKRQELFLKFFPSDFKLTRHSQSGSAWHPMVVLILFPYGEIQGVYQGKTFRIPTFPVIIYFHGAVTRPAGIVLP